MISDRLWLIDFVVKIVMCLGLVVLNWLLLRYILS